MTVKVLGQRHTQCGKLIAGNIVQDGTDKHTGIYNRTLDTIHMGLGMLIS